MLPPQLPCDPSGRDGGTDGGPPDVAEEASARESKIAIKEGEQRISALQQMVGGLAPRVTTQVRTIPNQMLTERLKGRPVVVNFFESW